MIHAGVNIVNITNSNLLFRKLHDEADPPKKTICLIIWIVKLQSKFSEPATIVAV